jgi:hypothetical protein
MEFRNATTATASGNVFRSIVLLIHVGSARPEAFAEWASAGGE